jgi:hypothetical protein
MEKHFKNWAIIQVEKQGGGKTRYLLFAFFCNSGGIFG